MSSSVRPARTTVPPGGDPFEALGDPNRRAIVELLGSGGDAGRSVRELADVLPISRPAVSRHLRLLKDAGLVTEEPRGTRRIYRLHDQGLEAVRAYLDRVWGEAASRASFGAGSGEAVTARVPTSDRSVVRTARRPDSVPLGG